MAKHWDSFLSHLYAQWCLQYQGHALQMDTYYTIMAKGAPDYNTILVDTDPGYNGMQGTNVTQAKLFLSFCYEDTKYHCTLVDHQ